MVVNTFSHFGECFIAVLLVQCILQILCSKPALTDMYALALGSVVNVASALGVSIGALAVRDDEDWDWLAVPRGAIVSGVLV